MPPTAFVPLAAYLVGAIPFGYLVARLNGVDIFRAGSGNIGATNVARVVGRRAGLLVFALDMLKGAVPVALAVPLSRLLTEDPVTTGRDELVRVLAAVAAFLGHLFPVWLGFRGGKGVATGLGTVLVLVPGPAAVALLVWLAAVSAKHFVSFGSILGGPP